MADGFSAEDIVKLEKRIDHLQYDELKEVKEQINNTKLDLAKNNLLTQQAIDSNDKLSDTMETIKDTMVEITQSVKDSNRISSELAETVKNLNDKVEKVEDKMSDKFEEFDEKMENIDDKSKVDVLTWLRDNWVGIVVIVGGLGYIAYKIIERSVM